MHERTQGICAEYLHWAGDGAVWDYAGPAPCKQGCVSVPHSSRTQLPHSREATIPAYHCGLVCNKHPALLNQNLYDLTAQLSGCGKAILQNGNMQVCMGLLGAQSVAQHASKLAVTTIKVLTFKRCH